MTVRSQRDTHGQVTYLAAGCKAWSCNHCGPKKADKLRKAIGRVAEEKKLTRMLTLTLDTKRLNETELRDGGIGYIRKSWGKLRVYLQRKYGQGIDFIAVVEMQKRGVAHLHILVDRFLPHDWVRDAWVAVGGGRIVDVRWVDIHRVSSYLAKYVSKEFAQGLPKGVRRYSVSRGIKLWEVNVLHVDPNLIIIVPPAKRNEMDRTRVTSKKGVLLYG
jgi:hypothetical protein